MVIYGLFEASILRIMLSVGDSSKTYEVICRRQLVKALYDFSREFDSLLCGSVRIRVFGGMSDGEYWQFVRGSIRGVWGIDSERVWAEIISTYEQCAWLASINVRVATAESVLSREDEDQ